MLSSQLLLSKESAVSRNSIANEANSKLYQPYSKRRSKFNCALYWALEKLQKSVTRSEGALETDGTHPKANPNGQLNVCGWEACNGGNWKKTLIRCCEGQLINRNWKTRSDL